MESAVAGRPYGVWTSAALVIGLMVGTGVFNLPAQLAGFGWTAVLAWVIAGAGTLAIAVPLVRLITARPQETGLMAICGAALGPWFGAANAWAYWTSVWCANAVVTAITAQYAASLVPGLRLSTLVTGIVGSLLLLFNTALNLRGPRAAGRTQVVLSLLKLLPFVMVLGMFAQIAVSPRIDFAGLPLAPLRAGDIGPALAMAFFALLGFEAAGLVSERVRDPERNVLRATLYGMGASALLYLVICTGIAAALPRAELAASDTPVAQFAGQIWGNWAAKLIALSAAISGFGANNAGTLLLGELPLGLARAGQLPAWLGRVNRHDVCAGPLLVGNGLAIALLLGSATTLGENLVAFLLKLTTAVSLWLYVAVAASALLLGIARAWSLAALLFCGYVLYGAGLEAGGLAILLALAGLPLYWLSRRVSPPA